MSELGRDLLGALYRIDGVTDAELRWDAEGFEVRVRLTDMDWQVRAAAIAAVEGHMEQMDAHSGANVTFAIPEPVEFTRYRVASNLPHLPAPF